MDAESWASKSWRDCQKNKNGVNVVPNNPIEAIKNGKDIDPDGNINEVITFVQSGWTIKAETTYANNLSQRLH